VTDYGGNTPDPSPTDDGGRPAQSYQDNDIRNEYHLNSSHGTEIFKPDGYRQSVPDTDTTEEPEPWAPFRTREDFEFAEIASETAMTKGQTDALIKFFHKCIKGEGNFTILNHKDMMDTFKVFSNRLTKVE